MAHARKQIRDALVTAFAGLTATAYPERSRRIAPDFLPAVVFSLTEAEADAAPSSMGDPWAVDWSQNLAVEIFAQGVGATAGLDAAEAADALELEIEAAIAADVTLGGIVENITPAGSTVEVNTDQDRVLLVRSVAYSILWRADFGAPDTPEG